jgi:hypothetical protein
LNWSGDVTINKRKKPFVDLHGRAVWLRSAELFISREDVVQTLVAIAPEGIPRLQQATLDVRILLFTLGVSLVSGLLFGLASSLRPPWCLRARAVATMTIALGLIPPARQTMSMNFSIPMSEPKPDSVTT